MNKRVVIPGQYWKAICDPHLGESILITCTNPYGVKETKNRIMGCGFDQLEDRGVIECLAVITLKNVLLNKFALADFHTFPSACDMNQIGKELKKNLNLTPK